jgi:UDP-glucose:(heptosyl)LPS alpha-1,3-glucosyltransferase
LALDKTPGSPLYRAGDGCHAAWLDRRAPYEPAWKRASFRFNPRHRAKLDLERRVFASPELKKVIANSRMAAEEVSRYYGLAPEKITVIYNGVDEERLDRARPPQVRERMRAELGLDLRQPVLLFLGSGFERKGLAFALAALRRLPGVVLLTAGRDRTARYEKTARRLGLGQRVRFLGQRPDAPELIAACDAMLLPTIYDPCANACLEALYLGRPVVTTLANGAAELLQEGLSGQAVTDPADEAALALACERALGMARGFAPAAPSRKQWLDQTVRLMEEAAS